MVLACVLVMILGLGALGVYHGLQERDRLDRKAAWDHYNKGVAHLGEGDLELAIVELESALRLNPEGEDIQDRLDEAKAAIQTQPTPTSLVRLRTAQAYYEKARTLFEQARWEEAIVELETVVALDPTYRREEIDTMLFESFSAGALRLRDENRLEEAILRWDRALQIRPVDEFARRQRDLASLYLTGIDYWGANWQRAVESFQQLYATEPGYLDTEHRLGEAYERNGDEFAQDGQWCEAEQQYGRALQILPAARLQGKRDDAAQQCSTPVATPRALPSEEITRAPKGTFVGEFIEYQMIEGEFMIVRGRVLDADEKGIVGTRVQIGAWNWSAVVVTNGDGTFSFDGLSTPATYTVSLLDLTSVPVDVRTQEGRLAWLQFREVE